MTMEQFIPYFISVNLLLLLQAVYYRLFLSRQRRFALNRIYLLGGLAIALALPLLRWEVVPPTLPDPGFIHTLPEVMMGSVEVQAPAAAPTWSTLEIAGGIYLLGVFVALTALMLRNLQVMRLILKGKRTRHPGYTLVESAHAMGPASYFKFIFWNKDHGMDEQGAKVALAHELCHSRQLHTLDLLAMELMKAFCWINPAIYLLRRDLRQTHEFLADEAAMQVAGIDGIKQLLLARQLGNNPMQAVHSFYSNVKTRLMILSATSQRKTLVQYLMVLPLAALMTACTSLGHRSESPAGEERAMAAAKPASDKTYFFDVEDMLDRAQLPNVAQGPRDKGLVCLGEMPEVMNLDTPTVDQRKAPEGGELPEVLNLDKIAKLVGYPQEAKDEKITGKVVVKVLVDATGHVARHQYLDESHPLLRNAVEAHVEELLFKPGKTNGKYAEWWVIVPFNFGVGC
jgi:TonB family protein